MINPDDFSVLYCLYLNNGLTDYEIDKLTNLGYPKIHRIADNLENRGFVSDMLFNRQALAYFITESGKNVVRSCLNTLTEENHIKKKRF